MHTKEEKVEAFGRLLDILDELREKCPWDRKQTNESLRPNTIEEVYELCDALMKNDEKNICKELGDVLLHVVFYAKIGSETGAFDIKDVCDKLCDKLIFRHPHVFGEVKADTAEKVSENWEQIKLKEKDGNKSVLSGVPEALPSLIKSYRIQDKARNVGFDWEEREQVWEKVKEEISEFEAEVATMDKDKAEDAIQYVFVRLWEYRSDLNVDISLKNFLFTMTKNYVLNVIRNETSALEKNYEIAQGMSEYEDDLIVKMEKRERMDLVYKAIEKLPEQKKTICLLKLKEEMSNSEIAERMNLSVNTVKTHYSESLKFLRLCLKELLIIVIAIVLIGKIGV